MRPSHGSPAHSRPGLQSRGSGLQTRGSGTYSSQSCWRGSRFKFAVLLWTALTLWWFSLHALELHWQQDDRKHDSSYPITSIDANLEELYQRRSLLDAAAKAGVPLHQPGDQLGVCIVSADFWGSPTAGGTATAYHLLARVLSKDPSLRVTFLGATRRVSDCENAVKLNAASGYNISFTCLEGRHFTPEVVETEPYEQMSHAVVAWVRENIGRCDVIHGHEWGGLFVDLATLDNYRQLKPGLRLAIEAHGGHFWSTQGQVQRPLDITSLRIDHGERMTLHLASALIAPTHYMTAFLAQRGWRLPLESIVIPNVIPAVESGTTASQLKPVWRLAFFSRLEERKGIKLFVDAVNKLIATGFAFSNRFEVYFVGAEAVIDMRPSGEWLQTKTAQWGFPVHIKVNAEREEALRILGEEGTLLVQCSLIDNMPYVVAEAAAKGIPFLVFDVGGVLEMLDPDVNRGSVVYEPTVDALYAKLKDTLLRGDLQTAVLTRQVTTGQEQWLDWHANFAAASVRQLQQEDTVLAGKAASKQLGRLIVHRVRLGSRSLDVWNAVCTPRGGPDAPLLLLPEQYELLNETLASEMMVELLQMGMLKDNGVGALSFGIEVLKGKISFPNAPTWALYTGDESRCNDDIPVLIRRSIFCQSYLAEARIFRVYHSWVLSMLLSQAGWRMHTYPEVMFRATNYTTRSTNCMADKAPVERHLDFNSASNLYADAEEVMVNLHMAPFPKPASSIVEDFPTEQNHKGWQIGFLGGQDPGLHLLGFWPPENGEQRDGRWACSASDEAYPALQHSLMHPCAGGDGSCCGLDAAPIVTRFNSYFASKQAVLIMAYEVWPICGDGIDMEVSLTSRGPNGQFRHIFLRQGFEASQRDTPQRQKVEFRFELHVGDWVDLVVWPRSSHDCDGIYLVDMQLWENDGLNKVREDQLVKDPAEKDSKLHEVAVGEMTSTDGKDFVAAGGHKAQEASSTSMQARKLQGYGLLDQGAAANGSQQASPLRDVTLREEEPRGHGYLLGDSVAERYGNWVTSLR